MMQHLQVSLDLAMAFPFAFQEALWRVRDELLGTQVTLQEYAHSFLTLVVQHWFVPFHFSKYFKALNWILNIRGLFLSCIKLNWANIESTKWFKNKFLLNKSF
jgi:hypothetical protein